MRYVAAFLLATLGGKSNPSKADVQGILESIGLDVDDEKLSKVAIVALLTRDDRQYIMITLDVVVYEVNMLIAICFRCSVN